MHIHIHIFNNYIQTNNKKQNPVILNEGSNDEFNRGYLEWAEGKKGGG